MIALPPKNPCPKCGSNEWDGPRHESAQQAWSVEDGFGPVLRGDALVWTCVTCRYVVRTPCLDAKADHVLSS